MQLQLGEYCYHTSSGMMGAISAAPSCSYIDGLYVIFFYRASVRVRFFLEAEGILLKKIKVLIYINCELDSYTCNAKNIAL